MKILITGARGLLGSNLSLMYSETNDVIATGVNKPSFDFCRNQKLDINDLADLAIIEREKPDMVVNCAALTNVDYCEDHEDEAERINSEGVRNLAQACRNSGVYFVQISTDGVFDGKKEKYSEADIPNPVNAYGRSKLKGESFVKEIGGNYAIVRTTIYGWNHLDKFSLAEWMLDMMERGEGFGGFKDIYFTPILVNNLGRAILELYEKRYRGIIHVTGSESISKLSFAKKIARVFGLRDDLVSSISHKDLNFKAARQENLSLDVSKAQNILETRLLNVEEGLEEFKTLRDNGFVERLKDSKIEVSI